MSTASHFTMMTTFQENTAPTITHVTSATNLITPRHGVVPVNPGLFPPLLIPQNKPAPIRSERLEHLLLGYDIVVF